MGGAVLLQLHCDGKVERLPTEGLYSQNSLVRPECDDHRRAEQDKTAACGRLGAVRVAHIYLRWLLQRLR